MSFSDTVGQLDAACVSTFGTAATLYPKNGGEVSITGIIAPPPMLEEVLPGSAAGVTNVYFFVQTQALDSVPQRGDTVALNNVRYDVTDILVDSAGGATLKLRRNAAC